MDAHSRMLLRWCNLDKVWVYLRGSDMQLVANGSTVQELILCEFRWLMRSWGRNIFWPSDSEINGREGQAEFLFKSRFAIFYLRETR